jgi:hypothetical protein
MDGSKVRKSGKKAEHVHAVDSVAMQPDDVIL